MRLAQNQVQAIKSVAQRVLVTTRA